MSAGLAVSVASAGFLFAGGVPGATAHADDGFGEPKCVVHVNTWAECLVDPELAKEVTTGRAFADPEKGSHDSKRVKFNKDEKISQSIIDKVTRINIDRVTGRLSDISSLKGIGVFKNLKELTISGTWIQKIQGLDGLTNLEQLDLSSNHIKKIEGLDKLANLKGLALVFNRISKIEGLGNLTNLEYLWLDHNDISNVEGLTENTLQKFKRDFSYFEGVPDKEIRDLKEKDGIIENPELVRKIVSEVPALSTLHKLGTTGGPSFYLTLNANPFIHTPTPIKLHDVKMDKAVCSTRFEKNSWGNFSDDEGSNGYKIDFKFWGFTPGDIVAVDLVSDATRVGDVVADANGDVCGSFNMPADSEGYYEIAATDKHGVVRYIRFKPKENDYSLAGNQMIGFRCVNGFCFGRGSDSREDRRVVEEYRPEGPKGQIGRLQIKINKPEYVAGEKVDFELAGFTPGDTVTVELHSDVVKVAEVVADANGVAHGSFILPAGFTGEHELVGTDKHGLTSFVKLLIKDAPAVVVPDPKVEPVLAPKIKINKLDYVVGEKADFELAGFTPGDTVTVELHSDVVKVAEVVADVNGVARGSFNLPAGFTGEHELVGTDKHGLTSSAKLLIKDAPAAPTAPVPAPAPESVKSGADVDGNANANANANASVNSDSNANAANNNANGAIGAKQNSADLANTGADASLLGAAGVALLALAGAVTLVARRVKR